MENNWREGLSEDLKGNASLATFNDVDALANSYVELKSMQGNSIRIPGEDAGEDQRKDFMDKLLANAPSLMVKPSDDGTLSSEFYQSIGVPSDQKGYEVGEIEGVPSDFSYDNSKVDGFRELALSSNLTKTQFKQVMGAMIKQDVAAARSSSEFAKEDFMALQKEWGAATDDRMAAVKAIATKTGAPDHLIEAITNGSASSDVLKWMYNIYQSVGPGEGNPISTSNNQQSGRMSPSEAQEKIAEIYANKDHLFHKGDKAALKRMIELVELTQFEAK